MKLECRPEGFEVKYFEDIDKYTKGIIIIYENNDAIGYITYCNDSWVVCDSIDSDNIISYDNLEEIKEYYQRESIWFDFIKFK